MIYWPAVIKYDGDDELVYIGSNEDWIRDAESRLYNHKGDDYLIDSRGNIYTLDTINQSVSLPESTGSQIALEDFIKLVRIHSSNSHRCCIGKIYFRNIAEGIRLLASMNDND